MKAKMIVATVLTASLLTPGFSRVLFRDGFESGVSEWNEEIDLKGGTAKIEVSTTRSRNGKKSVRFVGNGCKRVELKGAPSSKFDWGKEYWLGYSIYVQKPATGFSIVNQHHSIPHNKNWSCPAGGNSFTIKTKGDKFVFYTSTDDSKVNVVRDKGGATANTEEFSKSYKSGAWNDVVMNFRYEPNGTGFMKIWLNGDKVFDNKGVTVYRLDACGKEKEHQQYLKIGLYLGGGSGEIFYDDIAIADGASSYTDVAPNGSSGPQDPPDDPPVGEYTEKLIYEESFGTNGALPSKWWSEGSSKAKVENGHLYLDANPDGNGEDQNAGTLWLNKEFSGDLKITFDVRILSSKEQSNNMNLFFLFSDPAGKSLYSTRSSRSAGTYKLYHDLNGYAVTWVANGTPDAARFRVRDLPGFDNLLAEKNTFEAKSNTTYAVELTRIGKTITYAVNGTTRLSVTDDKYNDPHQKGLIGFRTWQTELWWDNLKVYQLVEDNGGATAMNRTLRPALMRPVTRGILYDVTGRKVSPTNRRRVVNGVFLMETQRGMATRRVITR